MMFAVKLYSAIDVSAKPVGIPDNWPAEVIELHNNEGAPDDSWTIMSADELTAWKLDNQDAYNAWYAGVVSAGAGAALLALVASKISAARDFGIGLISQYGASNVLAGYTVDQVQSIMEQTDKLQAALNSGSLYVAIAELNALVPDEIIVHAATITLYRNKIQDYLGIPRT